VTENFGTGSNAFNIDFVTIGNPGNTADTSGTPNPAGAVGYSYNLGKYEVSRDLITKANAAGGLGITMADMSAYVGGLGHGGNYAGAAATGITWNEAARFVNWLNTSRGYQAAYNFTTSGANDNIALWGAGQYSGSNQFRHKDAIFVLPSVEEWYKGAYGSSSGAWYDYTTGSNIAPTKTVIGTTAGSAIYGYSLLQGPTDVTLAGGLSAYGTIGQGGNVWEWNETAYDGVNDSASEGRTIRGGAWTSTAEELASTVSLPFGNGPKVSGINTPRNDYGFRVAMVPEPSTYALFGIGAIGMLMVLRRKKTA
jgi:formylglycine-generating enzyme required for sulfatase activity